MVHGIPPWTSRAHGRVALIGETAHDAREVMVEGESGLLRTSPLEQRPEWIATRKRLEWPNGAIGQVFSADDPESLRGPQVEAAWCDELAKWRYGEATFDMLQFALRLGKRPRQLITTTPRPLPVIKRLIAGPRTLVTRAPTRANGSVPLKEVHATRGKYLRAEPVAALYEQGKVKHVGCFPLLEDEMCDFGINGLSSGASPDRLDAMVWAISAMLSDRYWDGPRITRL